LEFCPKCGGLMRPGKTKDGKFAFICTKCGYVLTKTAKKRIVVKAKEVRDKDIAVSEEEGTKVKEEEKAMIEETYSSLLENYEE